MATTTDGTNSSNTTAKDSITYRRYIESAIEGRQDPAEKILVHARPTPALATVQAALWLCQGPSSSLCKHHVE
jgi:hypothetical protein